MRCSLPIAAVGSFLTLVVLCACSGLKRDTTPTSVDVRTAQAELSPFNLVLDMAGWEATDRGLYGVGGHEYNLVVARYLNGASPSFVWELHGVKFDAVIDGEHLVMMWVEGRPLEDLRLPPSDDENGQPVALKLIVCISLDHQPLNGQSHSTTSLAPVSVTGGKIVSHTLSPQAVADKRQRALEEGAVRSLSHAMNVLEQSARNRTSPDRWNEFIKVAEAQPELIFDNTSRGRTHRYPGAVDAITEFMAERYGVELPGWGSTFYAASTYRATPIDYGCVAVWIDIPPARYAGQGVMEDVWDRGNEWMGDGSWLAKMIESDPNLPEGKALLPDPKDDVFHIHRQLLFFCHSAGQGDEWNVSYHGILESVRKYPSLNAHANHPPRLDHRFLSLDQYKFLVFSSNQRVTLLSLDCKDDRFVSKEFYRPMWSHTSHMFAANRPFFGDTFPEHTSVYPLLHPDMPADAAAGIDSTIVMHDSRLWMSGRVPSVIIAESYDPSYSGARRGFGFDLEHTNRGQGPYRIREYALPSGNGPVGMLLPVWVGSEAGVIALTESFMGEHPIDEGELENGRAYLVLPSKELVCSVELSERAKRLLRDLDRGFYHDKDAIRHAPLPGRPNRFLARLEGGARVRDLVIEIELIRKSGMP